MRRIVPTRRSVKISSRYSAFGSTLMSFVGSGLVAMSVVAGSDGLPAAGAVLHVRIVRGERCAVVPVRRLRRRHHRRRVVVSRRVVIARSVVVRVRPVVRTRPPEVDAAAHDHAGVRPMETPRRYAGCAMHWYAGRAVRSCSPAAARTAATEVPAGGLRTERYGCDEQRNGGPLHGPRITP